VVARQTVSALQIWVLRELAFADVDAYVRGAIVLASDLDRLAEFRRDLRREWRQAAASAEQFTAILKRCIAVCGRPGAGRKAAERCLAACHIQRDQRGPGLPPLRVGNPALRRNGGPDHVVGITLFPR